MLSEPSSPPPSPPPSATPEVHPSPTEWMAGELETRRQRNLYRVRPRVQSAPGVQLRLSGREFLSFASNDYLNLAADPRLARAAARAARRHGCGAGASPLVAG